MKRIRGFFSRFMQGRYGTDELARAEMILLLVLLLLTLVFSFMGVPILYTLGTVFWIVVLIHTYMRMLSKKTAKRQAENERYLELTGCIRKASQRRKKHRAERDSWRYFTCPQCRQKVRVPAGRGKISITCPRCRTEFTKRT